MAIAIACRYCPHVYGFTDEPITWGPLCPDCGTYGGQVEVEIDEHESRLTRALQSPSPTQIVALLRSKLAQPERAIVERERVVGLVDGLDVRLALWIAEARLTTDDERPVPSIAPLRAE